MSTTLDLCREEASKSVHKRSEKQKNKTSYQVHHGLFSCVSRKVKWMASFVNMSFSNDTVRPLPISVRLMIILLYRYNNAVNACRSIQLLLPSKQKSIVPAPASPSAPPSTSSTTHSVLLLLLHDSNLLRAHSLHVHISSEPLSTTWSRRRLELALRMR